MADIFVSYTSSDRDWAHWIGLELEKLGHRPRIHEWEISAGGDIVAWMEERHDRADHILCVIGKAYLAKDYSGWERRAAQWAAASTRPNFALPVFVEDCEPPSLLAHFKRCDLYGLSEDDARERLGAYLQPAAKPAGPMRFPGDATAPKSAPARPASAIFPGAKTALSNVPITIPLHFLGRDDALGAIDAALKRWEGRVAITALHGLRGVGKTTLAAAYAELHRAEYRATWWIRAQSESTMRADLTALGLRLGWVGSEEKEAPALAAVRERLRDEGEGLLLIYDNAIDAASLKAHLPPGGAARVLVTSNAHAWRGVAAPVEIRLWPRQIGADYLIARTGREKERADAEALSQSLGGLPLAHEQAAAYCERLEVSFADYRKRFDGLTVSKTFALGIDEAAKLHPAAEPLIVHAALLAPEPIPLFLLVEGREKLGEPLSSMLADDGLDEAIAALRAFALVDRETIADEREPAIATETIRLHRLVREVAAVRRPAEAREAARRGWIEAMAAVYPSTVYNDPGAWPRARRLDALALALVGGDAAPAGGVDERTSDLQILLGQYRQWVLAAYLEARPFFERALAIRQKAFGPEHPYTAQSLNNFALLLQAQGDLAAARPIFERALAIREKALGAEHPDTATGLNNLALLLLAQDDLAGARPLFERALSICEKTLGPEHPHAAANLNNLARLLQAQGDLAGARPLFDRALVIREKALGPGHPDTAQSLNNLALLLQAQGDLAGARRLFERALATLEKALRAEHPNTNRARHNLARLRLAEGAAAEALALAEAALAAHERASGPNHPWTRDSARLAADALAALGRADEAAAVRSRHGLGGGA